jgi:hypothetical protein
MQDNRNETSEPAPRRANTPPPVGEVHGLGLVDVLRVELRPAQQPWLVDEIEALRRSCETDIAGLRERHDGSRDAPDQGGPEVRDVERQLDSLAYKLRVLAMIREQLPLGSQAAAAAVASPWEGPPERAAPEPERPGEEPRVVVGPAAVITQLVEGATRSVAEALASALGGPGPGAEPPSRGGRRPPGSVLPGITAAIARRLRATAAAAQAYTDIYVDLMLQQGYKFDPHHEPLRFGELE